MACDIYVHAEVKIDGTWHHYSQGSFERKYKLFAKMANVRNSDEAITHICLQKGVPDDITLVTRIDYEKWAENGQSFSWLNATEISIIEDWFDSKRSYPRSLSAQLGWLFGNSFRDFHSHREEYPEQIQDIRWVLWFDNF